MARLARVTAPGLPHHVTQRGNRRQQTFFGTKDYRAYLDLMAEWCDRQEVAVWAYCLMPDHVHLVAVPREESGLGRAIGEAHRRYTLRINRREGLTGHLWQGRFASFPLDGDHLLAAARHVELNPVRAGLVRRPERWKWSSAGAHLSGRDDKLVQAAPLLEAVGDWRGFLGGGLGDDDLAAIRKHERTGRPLGCDAFVASLETVLGRSLKRRKPGPKPKGPAPGSKNKN